MEKIALFELSTTAIRLTLGKMVENEYFYVYKEFSEYIQINEHIESDGLIKTAKIKECIGLLQIYKKICEAEGITKMHCVVAASLAEAKNYSSFLDEANNTCGLEFKLLTDAEEVGAVYTAVINTLDVPKGVIINISSYSTRIIHYNRRVVLDSAIIPYGSASLFKEGSNPDEAVARVMAELGKKVGFMTSLDPETALVGISEVFTSFGRLSRKMRKVPVDIDHNFHANTENFEQVFEFMKGLSPEKKQKLKGISSHSADTILAGMCIVEAVLRHSKLSNIIVGSGYRNIGLMLNYAMPFTVERPVSDVLGYSLEVVAASAVLNKSECEARYNLALLLFRQLKVLHKLPRGYLKVLRVASYLYHLGKRINNFGYEKINYHAILNCNVNGVSHKEIVLSAFTAAQKKWEDFNLAEWVRYKDIVTDDDLEAVRKLSIIVAMAEALNVRNCGAIKDISCDILGDSVILKLIAEESAKATKTDVNALYMEIFYAKKYSAEFARAFRKNMEIL
jgi:exopolyphosphatase/guanosine-5'-triphosphate,3'-diphosphate pyrophosphatase